MMKNIKTCFLAIAFLVTSYAFAQGGTIVIEGNYQGKNVYIQNPFGPGGVGFCISEVIVNGNITTDETNSSAFEIDLKAHKLKVGDKVEIKLKHKSDCKPKVLNPEVLRPKSTFEVVKMELGRDGTLNFKTKNESGKLTFIIEQFRWNKWVKVGEVEGSGLATENAYTFKLALHSGRNQVRVQQTDYSGQKRLSPPSQVISPIPELRKTPDKVSKDINFITVADEKPTETMYEIYDQYGNIVKRGFGNKVDVANLPKGGYFINFDNKMEEFFKR